MADPSRYEVSYDFSAFEETSPNAPKPGVQLDVQFADIQTSTTELRNAIKDVRRSDGALQNGIVTEDSLHVDLLVSLLAQTEADQAAASAVAAAASATAADVSADAAAESVASLETVAEILAEGGFYAHWGDWHSEPGLSSQWGDWS